MPADLSPSGDLIAVLRRVREAGHTTRADLGRDLGLRRGVVTQRVSALLDLGLVDEAVTRRSSGGRAPRELAFRRDAGFVLVADLGATTLVAGVADLSGALVATRESPADVTDGPERVLEQLESTWVDLVQESGVGRERIWGAGIGVPGPVEFATGRPISPPIMPGWDSYPVRERLATAFDVPVWVDNEVNLEALGESRIGLGRGVAEMIFVKMSVGIGSGVISRSVLHRGANGAAGDIGHIAVVQDETATCRCGNTGCLEAVAGGLSLVRTATERAALERSSVLGRMVDEGQSLAVDDITSAAGSGDAVAVDLLTHSGRLVGDTLSTLVNFYNPGLLVLGGRLVQGNDVVLSTVRETVYGRSLPLATRNLVIARSELGPLGGLVGAAVMVVDELFSRTRFPLWSPQKSPHGHPEIANPR
ncbi:ROK family transcriptional regulator [Longivirga aurantiaca]|uniref:ROK family protein n=1 Tax=Longivirga aurantiaca TaxID=1837743 RepID=A0ABW1SXZ3_9ACTN